MAITRQPNIMDPRFSSGLMPTAASQPPAPVGGSVPALDPRGIVPVSRTQPQPGIQRLPEQGLGSVPPKEAFMNGVVPVDRPGAALPPDFRGQPSGVSFEAMQKATMAEGLGPRARAASEIMQTAIADREARARRLGRSGLRAALASRQATRMPKRVSGLLHGF